MDAFRSRGTLGAAIFTLLAFSISAQTPPQTTDTAQRIDAVEEKLRALQQQADELRRELEALRAGNPSAEPTPEGVEDLTAIEPVDQPAPSPSPSPSPTPDDTTLASDIVANAPTTTSRNIFNPEISVIGNVLGHAGDENEFDPRDSIALDEAELSLQAFVDPYAKAAFFIGIGEEGVELEEGYAQFLTLPFDLTAKAGKMKANFGKFNTLHFHAWQWIDQPLVSRTFFGEGIADSGISVSKLFPNRWNLFLEATGEIYRGSVEELFEPERSSDLLYVGHLKFYRDLTESANVELGGSWASGPIAEAGRSEFTGVDLTYRWKPLERSIYRSFISRTELIRNERDDQEDAAFGFYTSADYQFARRWLAGIRLDGAERPDDPSLRDRGGALTLTFRPSEFSQVRGQYRRINYDGGPDANEFLLQLQFAIGAHGAHTF
jgi:hypothetical protein